jgi:hypothetical protein
MFTTRDWSNAEKEFIDAFGRTLMQWGIIEQRLCFWFHRITGMNEKMARQVFYSVTSFSARSRVLRGVIQASDWHPYAKSFLETACSKAITYDSFRNQIVHRETKFDGNSESKTFKRVILVEGKLASLNDPLDPEADLITVDELNIACDNFRELSRLIMDGFQCPHEPASLQECHKLVHAMPTRAHSREPNQKPLELPPLPEPSQE